MTMDNEARDKVLASSKEDLDELAKYIEMNGLQYEMDVLNNIGIMFDYTKQVVDGINGLQEIGVITKYDANDVLNALSDLIIR